MNLHKTTGHDHPRSKICADCPADIPGYAKRCGPCSDRHNEIAKRLRDSMRSRKRAEKAKRAPA